MTSAEILAMRPGTSREDAQNGSFAATSGSLPDHACWESGCKLTISTGTHGPTGVPMSAGYTGGTLIIPPEAPPGYQDASDAAP